MGPLHISDGMSQFTVGSYGEPFYYSAQSYLSSSLMIRKAGSTNAVWTHLAAVQILRTQNAKVFSNFPKYQQNAREAILI